MGECGGGSNHSACRTGAPPNLLDLTKASFTNVTETHFTVSGLTQNAQYEFRVFARNAVGSISNPSEVVGPITCIDSYGKHF